MMPVVGTPLSNPEVDPATVVSPRTTRYFDVPAPEKLRSVRVTAGTAPVVSWTMSDPGGLAVDLSRDLATSGFDAAASYGAEPGSAVLRIVESATQGGPTLEYPAASPDPAAGTLEARIDLADFAAPGVYLAEFAVAGGDGVPLAVNRFYLGIEPSLFAGTACAGPPTVPEIRLMLRDSSPAESNLLDNVTFDDAEVLQATRLAVSFFNEYGPGISTVFDTTNFPSRYFWMRGIAAILFSMAAEYYRKNQLTYGAGGVNVDDFNKAPMYEAAYDKYWAEYKTWCLQTALKMSQDECWGSVDSPYAWRGGW